MKEFYFAYNSEDSADTGILTHMLTGVRSYTPRKTLEEAKKDMSYGYPKIGKLTLPTVIVDLDIKPEEPKPEKIYFIYNENRAPTANAFDQFLVAYVFDGIEKIFEDAQKRKERYGDSHLLKIGSIEKGTRKIELDLEAKMEAEKKEAKANEN